MAKQVERARKSKHRTRSEFVREALRWYLKDAAHREKLKSLTEEEPTADELAAMTDGAADFKAGRHQTLARVRHELLGPRRRPRKKRR